MERNETFVESVLARVPMKPEALPYLVIVLKFERYIISRFKRCEEKQEWEVLDEAPSTTQAIIKNTDSHQCT